MINVNTKRTIQIVAGDSGEIVELSGKRRIITSITYGSSLFSGGSATIQLFEPMGIEPLMSLGGIWQISIDDIVRFQGFLSNAGKQRYKGGNLFSYNLIDVSRAWDVLLTNTVFPTSANPDYKVTDFLTSLKNTVGGLSGIYLNGVVPINLAKFTDIYKDGTLSVTDSSYLAEIQKACQNIGYLLIADVAFADLVMLDALSPSRGDLNIDLDYVERANFDIDILSIPATVLVTDDLTQKAKAYGYLGTGSEYNHVNYDMTKINNIFFATVVGVDETALAGIAQKIYNLSRKASQVLTVVKADLEEPYDRRMLGLDLNWDDSSNRRGEYTVSEYMVSVAPDKITAEIKAYLKAG